jgi:hypothetical protein
MTDQEFSKIQNAFELQVIAEGIRRGVLGKKAYVPVRGGKLFQKMSKVLGAVIPDGQSFAVDYYGYLKKSQGLKEDEQEWMKEHPAVCISATEALVVHFASIKLETVATIDPESVASFHSLKQETLVRRGFKDNGNPQADQVES